MFDQRSYMLVKEITSYEKVTKSEVLRKLHLSERQFNNDLEKVNNALNHLNMSQIAILDNVFITDEKLAGATKAGMNLDINPNTFVISEQDRLFLIYLYTFIRQRHRD